MQEDEDVPVKAPTDKSKYKIMVSLPTGKVVEWPKKGRISEASIKILTFEKGFVEHQDVYTGGCGLVCACACLCAQACDRHLYCDRPLPVLTDICTGKGLLITAGEGKGQKALIKNYDAAQRAARMGTWTVGVADK